MTTLGRAERSVLLAVPAPETAAVLEQALAFIGRRVRRAVSGAEALAAVQGGQGEPGPGLIVMDLAQPDVDGLVLVADLRARTRAPMIVLGEVEEGDHRRESLLVFRLGADDFVSKPFDVDDVVARVEAALRRPASPGIGLAGNGGREVPREVTRKWARIANGTQGGGGGVADGAATVKVGDLALDRVDHRVTLGGGEVRLSRSEYLLLGSLMGRPDELLSRGDLARAVWGERMAQVGRPIDQHLYRLRAKLHAAARMAGVPAPAIVSVPGFGYRLRAHPDERRAAA